MPRAPRVFVDGATYHVHCRLARAQAAFQDDESVRQLLDVFREVRDRDSLSILAWCVMADHYQLVVRCGVVPLWRTMRLLQSRFARRHNRRRGERGALWEGRYRARALGGDRDLRNAIAYVHLGPVAAGLTADVAGYPWSGHRELVAESDAPLADAATALAAFGEPIAAARRSYAEAVVEASEAAWVRQPPGRLTWWRAGRGTAAIGPRGETDVRPQSAPRPRLTALELVELGAAATGASASELLSSHSGARLTRRRELLALLGVELFGVRVKDLAEVFGRHPGSVSRWVTTAGKKRARDADYRTTADELAAAIVEAERSARAVRSGFVFESRSTPFSG